MKKLLGSVALGALLFGAPLAHADLVVGTDDFCQTNGNACLLGGEQKVFLEANPHTMHGIGDVGAQSSPILMHIDSDGGMLDTFIDLKNGFSTIKPSNGISFNGVDISIPGYTFGELIFHTQLTTATQFTVQGFSIIGGLHAGDGAGLLQFAGANSDDEYRISALGPLFKDVDISALGGFDEIKQIEVGGLVPDPVPTPEPGTLAIFGSAILGLGIVSWYRRRKDGDITGAAA